MTLNSTQSVTSRRQSKRRLNERRARHAFGSSEWKARIKQENLMWPKSDRRYTERRSADRRMTISSAGPSGMGRQKIGDIRIDSETLLTAEEIKMIQQLMSAD